MSFALGQPVPLRALVYDDTGALDDAETVTLTITAPDGTTTTPTVDNPPSATGTYEVDYLPAQVGLYTVRWVFGGINASAPPVDSFYVDSQVLPPLVSLAEAREQCRVGSTGSDKLLQRYAMVASSICERRTQVWRRQTLTQTRDGGGTHVRLRRPVISISTVMEDGVAVASTGYVLISTAGLLYRGTGRARRVWSPGLANVVVTYEAGASDGIVPDPIRQGVLLLTEHLWNTQRGGSGLPRSEGADFSIPVGFTLPSAVREEWDPWIPLLVA